ncbi:MAG: hypothetical protein U5J63_17815 [Fodinibius sp.]|nr:hypothetical protein [Fodinibius sp.]
MRRIGRHRQKIPASKSSREVIERKQQWRQKLDTYRAEAYTRQDFGQRYLHCLHHRIGLRSLLGQAAGPPRSLKSKRQTANIEAADNVAGVSYLPNFYDDNIEIAGFELVGVTHPDALSYYDFKLANKTSIDGQTVFKIEVITRSANYSRSSKALFTSSTKPTPCFGSTSLPATSSVSPDPSNPSTSPTNSNSTTMGRSSGCRPMSALPATSKSPWSASTSHNKIQAASRITNYQVNAPLPDSLYDNENTFSVDSTSHRLRFAHHPPSRYRPVFRRRTVRLHHPRQHHDARKSLQAERLSGWFC